ncbi:MAG: hypothetical protein HY606_01510, partial [Planctomycetes bacterium]|nr:hypothetical protein [Planctomycetota bacterium]
MKRSGIRALIMLVTMLLISLPLYPEKQNRKTPDDDPMMRQIDRLQKEIYVLSIFDRLNLT